MLQRAHASSLHIAYATAPPEDALGVINFQGAPTHHCQGLSIHSALRPLPVNNQSQRVEYFSSQGRVTRGQDHGVQFACDGVHLLAQLELVEAAHGGIEGAAEVAYQRLRTFNAQSGYPQVLRLWNYFDAINLGVADAERYKRFCAGRGRGFGQMQQEQYPAASAIGTQTTTGKLQLYWLAAKQPGTPLENPRQISAYHYPRNYGPTSPSFARGCLLNDGALLISGTASIVGHESTHANDVTAQFNETLNNIEALIDRARTQAPWLAAHLNTDSVLKIYVRHAEHAADLAATLKQRCSDVPQHLFVSGDICRKELLVEVDCVHGQGAHRTHAS